MNDEDDPRAGTELSELVQDLVDERLEARERPAAPRGFTPRIVGGIDHAAKPKDKKRALARALSRHGLGKRDDDTRPLGGEEFVDMVRQLPPAQQWEIHDELMKRAKARASESAPSRNKRLRQSAARPGGMPKPRRLTIARHWIFTSPLPSLRAGESRKANPIASTETPSTD